ncbi:MAG: alkaline phosphatase family protein [Deltaproteobacteria bacterium]|nr:alkaline phosphatase family protein [Deltaproteobacteria bacterium]
MFQRAIMILADGAREDLFRELLAKGELPHIEKEIVRAGCLASGVTAFPSTTGPAYFPFITGCFPGTLNVPGIRWLEKKKFKPRSYVGIETFLINHDVNPVPTIFDLIPKSYNIFNSVCRGAGRRNLTRIMRIWYWYYAHLTDRWEFLDQQALKKTLKALERDFEFLFVVFPGIDEYSHLAHPRHEKTIEQYRFLDAAVGQIVAKLKHLRKWDGTLFWIVSDHGLSRTDTHFCVNTFLERRDLKPFYYPKVYHRRGRNVANMMSGNAMTHLYFKNGGWEEPACREDIQKLSPGLTADLLKEPAVDILAVKNREGGVDILSKRGEASLRWEPERLNYQVKTKDPFGFQKLPATLDRQSALDQTISSDYPDALWQLAYLFQSSRTGDMVLSAAPGYDFRKEHEIPEHKGSHGSLHREHMAVPIAVNTPLPQKYFRTADVFPTTLRLLGREIPRAIDGQPIE